MRFTRRLPFPLTRILAVLTGLALIGAGLLATSVVVGALWICAAPLPLLVGTLIDRTSARRAADSIRHELAQRGPLPRIDDTPQRFRARQVRDGATEREHVPTETAQEQSS